MHAHEEEEGAAEEGVGVEGHGKRVLTDDHVEGRAWGVAHEEVRFAFAFERVAGSRGRERRGHFGFVHEGLGSGGEDGLRLGGGEESHSVRVLCNAEFLHNGIVCVYDCECFSCLFSFLFNGN